MVRIEAVELLEDPLAAPPEGCRCPGRRPRSASPSPTRSIDARCPPSGEYLTALSIRFPRSGAAAPRLRRPRRERRPVGRRSRRRGEVRSRRVDRPAQLPGVAALDLEAELPRVEPAREEDVVRRCAASRSASLAITPSSRERCSGPSVVVALDQRHRRAVHRGKRCPQLVRDRGDEVAAHPLEARAPRSDRGTRRPSLRRAPRR